MLTKISKHIPRKTSIKDYLQRLHQNLENPFPLQGQLELTYRCDLDCIHCYCKDYSAGKELSLQEWRHILDQLYKEGTIWLTLTGGDPLLRSDFLSIYAYARAKGFLIAIMTNGILLEDKLIAYLKDHPPYLIEITLNGITREKYELMTNTKNSFKKIMKIIHRLAEEKLPLVLKTNGLKQNKDDIIKIKKFTENLLGKRRFKFDSFIFPRLNGDNTPCNFRLSPEEIICIEESDRDMTEFRKEQFCTLPEFERGAEYLYHCSSWLTQFFIDPYGRLKFCYLSNKYSIDLRRTTFKEGFYNRVSRLLNEQFKTDSKCKSCNLRSLCYYCPARSYLETGDEESPVVYFCELAKMAFYQKDNLLGNHHIQK